MDVYTVFLCGLVVWLQTQPEEKHSSRERSSKSAEEKSSKSSEKERASPRESKRKRSGAA